MPLQTSRYLTMFSLVIVCICGFTLLDQFAGPSKLADADNLSQRRRSVRTTRSLQPGPPVEPQWVQPSQDFVSDGYDYPSTGYQQMAADVPVQAASFSNQTSAVDFSPAAASQSFEPWEDTTAVSTAVAPPPPGNDFTFDEFASGQPEESQPPQLPELPALPTDFDEPPADAWPDDADLGPYSDDPWGDGPALPKAIEDGPVAVMEVDQPVAAPVDEAPADRLVIRDTVEGSSVVVAGFAGSEMSKEKATATTDPKPRSVGGSYRIRSLQAPQRNPKRLRGTFRFSAPEVEQPADVRRDSAVKQMAGTRASRPACQHKRAVGQRVCPKCGVIHSK
ncbi:MAG: hypothetical protein AB8G99_01650 [Planctomycetaceae bacterium]